ncbi:MAG: hypothetical protein JNK05_18535 [Myxococcales bacterium]|nr:hypothetical protein [Myxococcales bacterium]
MRTPIRAASIAAAFALIHCAPPPPPPPDVPAVDASMMTDTRPDTASGPSPAGNACTDDSMCGTLSCDTSIGGGLCTSTTCTQNASQANEAMQCGGTGATCLTIGDGADANAFCVKSCRPTMNPNCRPGHVCTGWWSSHMGGTPDSPGCFPFCSQDSHCNTGERCNARTGTCQMAAPNPALLNDGQPCRIPTGMQPSPCKGVCFRVVTGNPNGVCGSFVNLATASMCPDDPDAVQPLGRMGMDNLGICIFRSCSATQCCPNGLVCEGMDGMGFCSVDDPMEANIACTGGGDGGTDSGVPPTDSGVAPTDSGVAPTDSGVAPVDAAADGG